jgi:hypothetical protein
VVGIREKLRELIVFIASDADTPLDKVRRDHALCCDSSGMTQDATQLGIGRASVYRALAGSLLRFQLKSGLTSAPRLPQVRQTNRGAEDWPATPRSKWKSPQLAPLSAGPIRLSPALFAIMRPTPLRKLSGFHKTHQSSPRQMMEGQ